LVSGFKIQVSGLAESAESAEHFWFRVQDEWFKVQSSRVRVKEE